MFQRISLCAMIVIEAATLRAMSGHGAMAVALGALGLAGAMGIIRIPLAAAGRQRLLLAIGGAFAIYSQMMPEGGYATAQYGNYCVVAQGCLAIQCAWLFLKTADGRLPAWLLLAGCAAMVAAGNRFGGLDTRSLYFAHAIAFGLAAMAFLSGGSPRAESAVSPRRGALLAACMAVALLLGAALSRGVVTVEAKAVQLLGETLSGALRARAGFSHDSRLGSIERWKSDDAGEVALRVMTARPPGYLRGRAHVRYEDSVWQGELHDRRLDPLEEDPPRRDGLFAVVAPPPGERPIVPSEAPGSYAEVWNETRTPEVVFAPLGARFARAAAAFLDADRNGALLVGEGAPIRRHRLYPGDETRAPGAGAAAPETAPGPDYLAIPDALDPAVRPLAGDLFARCRSAREKVVAVERHFRMAHRYGLGIQIPPDVDPVSWFLLRRPDAHCEYFASGAVMLLRLGGVPARYVTGFVATEENPAGGYWIARNRDAHAWAEAWVDGAWTTVEATPPSGVPGAESALEASALARWWDWLKFRLRRLKAAFDLGELQASLRDALSRAIITVGRWARTPAGVALVALPIAIAGIALARRRHGSRAPADPVASALGRALARMDRRVARRGARRLPTETVLRFAGRLRQAGADEASSADRIRPKDMVFLSAAAEWYVRYAALRFSGQATAGDAARLKEDARRLTA